MQKIIIIITIIFYSCNINNSSFENDNIENDINKTISQKIDKKINEIDNTIIRNNTKNKCNCIWDTLDIEINKFKKNTKLTNNINKIPSNIDEFYFKFISDSIYQYKKVDFNKLLGLISECDTTIRLRADNWEYIKYNYKELIKDKNLKISFYFSEDKFYYEVYRLEIGIMYQLGFVAIDSKWKLVFFSLYTC